MKNNENKGNSERVYIGKAKGPINIALIKYWGKDNENLITPLNNSISLTLDTNIFYTETKVTIQTINLNENINDKEQLEMQNITLKINGKNAPINSRIKNIFSKILKMKFQICQ